MVQIDVIVSDRYTHVTHISLSLMMIQRYAGLDNLVLVPVPLILSYQRDHRFATYSTYGGRQQTTQGGSPVCSSASYSCKRIGSSNNTVSFVLSPDPAHLSAVKVLLVFHLGRGVKSRVREELMVADTFV